MRCAVLISFWAVALVPLCDSLVPSPYHHASSISKRSDDESEMSNRGVRETSEDSQSMQNERYDEGGFPTVPDNDVFQEMITTARGNFQSRLVPSGTLTAKLTTVGSSNSEKTLLIVTESKRMEMHTSNSKSAQLLTPYEVSHTRSVD